MPVPHARLAAIVLLPLLACGPADRAPDDSFGAEELAARRLKISVSISPTSASVVAGGTVQFTAKVWGTLNTAVVWSVQEGAAGGTVTSTGLYTAPSATGTFHVVARSVADAYRYSVATVSVSAPPVVAVSVSPATASIGAGATVQFSATVTGSTNTAVAWSVQEGASGGSVSATGLYTAPASAGTFHVVAASAADPAKSAIAAVAVAAPVVAVSVSPATVSIATSATVQFSATVTGSTNTAVAWSVQEGASGGSVSATGLYTAPATAGTVHVVATSAADPAKFAIATVSVTSSSSVWITPSPITGDVVVSMDSSSGTKPVSPFIFGTLQDRSFAGIATSWRKGGNRLTGYDWENGYSNAGSDYGPWHNDTLLAGDGTPGSTVRSMVNGVYGRTGTWANAALVTLPTIGYVAGPWTGYSTLVASPDVFTTVAPPLSGSQAWRVSLPGRAGDTSHALATATPDRFDGYVYQDDFLAWFRANWPGHDTSATAPVFVALDNEPDLWGSTHMEIRGKPPTQHVQTGYDELANNNAAYARAVKGVLGQGAKVFGPVSSGWSGFVCNGNVDANGNAAKPPTGYDWYLGYYLRKMAEASASAGRRLLDVLDIHWYPEASSAGGRIVWNDGAAQDAAMIVAREQAPRSLWDPAYLENSWISYWDVNIPGCTWGGDPSKCSLKLLPTLRSMIGAYNPGTGIAVTEWSYGREMDVSNAIASADVLGIFAREGVYAANTWPMSGSTDGCLAAAMRAYLDYDGARSRFGDTFVPTSVSDTHRPVDPYMSGTRRGDGTTAPVQYLERVTAYASFDAGRPERAVVVAINKDLSAAINAGLAIKHNARFARAEAYRVTGVNGGSGGCTGPARQADVAISLANAFNATLPPQSVTVFVLRQ